MFEKTRMQNIYIQRRHSSLTLFSLSSHSLLNKENLKILRAQIKRKLNQVMSGVCFGVFCVRYIISRPAAPGVVVEHGEENEIM